MQVATHAATSVTQFGITWTFNGDYQTGQFANGDYWVVGPVTIINIDPPSIVVSAGGDPYQDEHIKNGSMINPSPTDADGTQTYQGFDSRLGTWNTAFNKARPNGNDLTDVAGGNPLVVLAGSSLVSAKSRTEDGTWSTSPKTQQLLSVAILTVLNEVPPEGSFRPTYCGNDKTVKFNVLDLVYERLGNYPLLGENLPTLFESGDADLEAEDFGYSLERSYRRPWIDFIASARGSYAHPQYNIPHDGLQIAHMVTIAALVLNSADYTNEEKEKLLICFVQVGIDNYGSVINGGNRIWENNGQIGPGRKFPILFAGMVLNNNEMKNIGEKSGDYLYENGHDVGNIPEDYIHFAEDDSTFYVTKHPNSETDEQKRAIWAAGTDQDYDVFVPNPDVPNPDGRIEYRPHARNANYYGHAYPGKEREYAEYMEGEYIPGTEFNEGVGHVGMPDWGIIHCFRRDYDGLDWDAPYRVGNGRNWGGFVLAAHMMGMKSLWNHNALFDYIDRFMVIENNLQSPRWAGEMWAAYRAEFGDVWVPGDPDLEIEPEPEPQPEEQTEQQADDDVTVVKTVLSIYNNVLKASGNNQAIIHCDLLAAGDLSVKIYDSKGKEIAALFDGHKAAGRHKFTWTASGIGSGIYLVYMKSGGKEETKKIAVVK